MRPAVSDTGVAANVVLEIAVTNIQSRTTVVVSVIVRALPVSLASPALKPSIAIVTHSPDEYAGGGVIGVIGGLDEGVAA